MDSKKIFFLFIENSIKPLNIILILFYVIIPYIFGLNYNFLFILFSIFRILALSDDYKLLSSPAFHIPYKTDDEDPMKNVIQFIHQNFQKEIKVNELQEISNMSNTTFFTSFKKSLLSLSLYGLSVYDRASTY